MNDIRWGIMATGAIAHALARAILDTPGGTLAAVASRNRERAAAFAGQYGADRAYGSYRELAKDDDLDVIYIATPHSEHAANMRMCLENGRHVLCEKAFTLNAAEARACIDLARERDRFLMEAMWMRFFPAMAEVRRRLAAKEIGEVRLVQADFCIDLPYDSAHRLYNPDLGGGALLDLGIYPLSLATMVLGLPDAVNGHAHLSPTGVDELDTITLTYARGASAQLTCSMRLNRPREAFLVGSDGYIQIHDLFFRPTQLTVYRHGRDPEDIHLPFKSNGYRHEVEEVQRCLREGRRESAIMPLDETLALMAIMDRLRRAWGVAYPGEAPATPDAVGG